MPSPYPGAIEQLACFIAAQTCDAPLGIPYPRDPDDDAVCLEWPDYERCGIDHQSADGTT